jgi:hypothetical protein
MVREGGLEPPRPCEHWHLKPARLPFRHSRVNYFAIKIVPQTVPVLELAPDFLNNFLILEIGFMSVLNVCKTTYLLNLGFILAEFSIFFDLSGSIPMAVYKIRTTVNYAPWIFFRERSIFDSY